MLGFVFGQILVKVGLDATGWNLRNLHLICGHVDESERFLNICMCECV